LIALEKNLVENALRGQRVKRLMTIGGVNAIVALGVLAAIVDAVAFKSPKRLAEIAAAPMNTYQITILRESGGEPVSSARSQTGDRHSISPQPGCAMSAPLGRPNAI
jgi:hypothetical protein